MKNIVLAQEILNAVQSLQNVPNSELERDLVLQKIRDLYSLIKNEMPAVASASFQQQTPNVIAIEEPSKKMESEVSQKVTETVIPEIEKPVMEKIEELQPKISPIEKEKSASLNDRFSNPSTPLHEQIQKSTGLNDRFVPGDLKALIDLNKQVVLTNELFKGNGAAFMKAVTQLNQSASYDQALAIASILQQEMVWNKDSQAARLLDKLLRQKFGKA
ncbi:MAG: hypothetical protein U0T73_09005 [Chitinophagales bacterium]